MILKNSENNGTEEIGLVTPTPDLECVNNATFSSTIYQLIMIDYVKAINP